MTTKDNKLQSQQLSGKNQEVQLINHVDRKEAYISVDVETSGPSPSHHALLSIGACTLGEPRRTFYIELQPDAEAYTHEAMAVSQLSLDRLAVDGFPPKDAMQRFANWVKQTVPPDVHPVFAAFNAPFDWMFVSDYFHRYLGYNPFGHKALDIKTYFMGLHGVSWAETSFTRICSHYLDNTKLTHHALDDAINQAKVFQAMLAEAREKRLKEEV
jgi:ribonuclease T